MLLFQDLAFIPLVALVPLLASHALPNHVPWQDVARGTVAIAVILVGGRFAIPPLIRLLTQDVPAEVLEPGSWMHEALDLRDQWRSKLLRTAVWSPLQ